MGGLKPRGLRYYHGPSPYYCPSIASSTCVCPSCICSSICVRPPCTASCAWSCTPWTSWSTCSCTCSCTPPHAAAPSIEPKATTNRMPNFLFIFLLVSQYEGSTKASPSDTMRIRHERDRCPQGLLTVLQECAEESTRSLLAVLPLRGPLGNWAFAKEQTREPTQKTDLATTPATYRGT